MQIERHIEGSHTGLGVSHIKEILGNLNGNIGKPKRFIRLSQYFLDVTGPQPSIYVANTNQYPIHRQERLYTPASRIEITVKHESIALATNSNGDYVCRLTASFDRIISSSLTWLFSDNVGTLLRSIPPSVSEFYDNPRERCSLSSPPSFCLPKTGSPTCGGTVHLGTRSHFRRCLPRPTRLYKSSPAPVAPISSWCLPQFGCCAFSWSVQPFALHKQSKKYNNDTLPAS